MLPDPASRSSADALVERAWRAYRQADAAGAAILAQRAADADPAWGEAWFVLACARERGGDLVAADAAFRRATQAERDPAGPPFRCSWRHFRRLVDEAAAAIPERLRPAFAELTLALEDYASPTVLDGYDEPELLGMFVGTPRGEEAAPGELSPRIHLWRRAHEHACTDAEAFAAEVRTTLFHEFGHYLGYDEEGLEKLGLR